MIDPTQLPILMKAIDFVFEEGRKILEERRERRRKQNELPNSEEKAAPLSTEKAAAIRQDLLRSQIDELLWHNHEQEVQHLVRLLETYSRNYYLAREQYAKWGDALVPPIIVNNLHDAENSMIETTSRLEAVLSRIYQKEMPALQ